MARVFRPHLARAVRCLLALCASLAFTARAAGPGLEASPYAVTNLSPFGILYGVPAIGEARVLAPGALHAELSAAAASSYAFSNSGREDIFLDGETHRVALRLRRGFGGGYEGTLELPWISHSGGQLDGFIIHWHDLFGLPQGGRERADRDRLLFVYRRDGVERVRLTDPVSGAGDARIGLGRSLSRDERWPLALRVEAKLPTGDSSRLTGSGAADVALWVSAALPVPGTHTWSAYGGAGLAWLGPGDVLPELQHRRIPFASAGIGWRALPRLAFKVQIDAHRALYARSDMPELGHTAVQVALGGSLGLGADSEFEFVVLEDLAVESVPDVTLRAALKMRY
jgi:hypothetical protein